MMKKLLTFLLTALLAFGVGWAATESTTISSTNAQGTSLTWSNSNLTFSFTQTPSTTNYSVETASPARGLGTGAKTGTHVLTSNQSFSNVSKVEVVASTNGSNNTLSVSVGGTAFGTALSITSGTASANSTYTFTASTGVTGNIVITINDNNKTVWIKSITVTYEAGGSTPVDPVIYKKVTSSLDLVAGKKYAILYENGSSSVGMGELDANRYGTPVTGLSLEDNKVDIAGTGVMTMTLGGESNAWTLYMDNSETYLSYSSGYVFFAAQSPQASATDITKWTITPSASATAIHSNNNTAKYIRYSSQNTSPVFQCNTVNYQSPVALYVEYAGQVGEISFSPAAGTYAGTQSVTISCDATSDATIYYTTDGSTPTTSSTVYTGPIQVTEDMTIKAIAVAPAMDSSSAEAAYTITAPSVTTVYEKITSTDDLTDGNYLIVYEDGSVAFDGSLETLDQANNNQEVTIVNHQIETDKQIYFTYDATAGTLKSASGYYIGQTSYDNGLKASKTEAYTNQLSIDQSGNAIIAGSGNSSGSYVNLKFNNASNNNRFRYYKSGQQAIQLYKEVGTPKVATPTFSPEPGTYTSAQSVTISCATEGATIHYTYNGGSEQTGTSPITLNVNSTAAIVAWATLTDYDDSEQATATYTIDLTPTMTVNPTELTFGTLAGDQLTVTTSNLTAGVNATVLNTDYSTNTDKWTVTPSTLGTDGGSMTVNYGGRLLKSDNNVRVSSNGVADVDVPVHYKHSAPIYIVTNANNWDFNSGTEMTRNGDTYSYTLNATADTYLVFTKKVGDDVNWNTNYLFGPVSSGDWWLTEESVDTDFALDSTAYHVVKMHHGTYTITLNAATNVMRIVADVHAPVFSLAEGRYYEAQTLEMTCDTEGAHIYYTTDGSTPSATNGTLYTGAITVDATMTVKAVAIFGNITSPVTTVDYTIQALGGDDYILTNTVTANDEYVLVYSSSTTDYAMGAFNSSNYYATTTSRDDFELNGTIVTRKSNNVNVLTLEPAGNGQYYIVDQDGYYMYYNSGNTVNHNAQLAIDNNAYKWTITIDNDGVATIENVGTSGRYLRCNPQASRYACYDNTPNAKLYKRAISEPRIRVSESTIDLGTIEAGGASVSNTFTVHGMNLTQDVTLSIEGENFTVQPTTISAADANNGYVTVTVTYSGSAATATANVTVNSQCDPKTVAITAARELLAVTITPASGTFSGSTMSGITIESNVSGATIYYSLDNGQSWNTYDGNGITVTAVSVGDRPTVQAYATYNGETSATVTATYERVAKSTTLFEKVTSDSQIKAGNKYIFVRDATTPYYALSGAGNAESVTMDSNGNIDIANTSTTVFTLGGSSNNGYNFYYVNNGLNNYLTHNDKNTSYSTTANTLTINQDGDNGYYVREDTYMFCYNAGNDPFRWYTSKNGSYAYLYVQGGQIEAPEILPASGTYYDNLTVNISDESDDVTIWYTTDGSDPATSATRQQYNGQFNVNYVPGTTTTIIAVAIDEEDAVSEPATVVYTWGTPSVVISPDSRNVTVESVTVTMTGTPANATIYYTTDGSTPTTASEQYNGAFSVSLPNVGDVANVKAIAVYNGLTSEVATATYTRVDKVIDVKAPFFSPLAGTNGGYSGIYYGEQTLQIGCTTPNADIYYKIEEVTGETAPATVADPTKQSSYYDATQTITMEVGKSYRVKAIAYVGGFASTITEGYYIIKSFSDFQNEHSGDGYTYVANCAEFNALTSTGANISFTNPVQVVYHSTYANNGAMAEFCYVRDNTDYACIYFGKRDTHDYHIFKMGDWIDGSDISGEMNIWENNFHNQLGTSSHTIDHWPSEALGWSEIIPTPTTCNAISSGTTAPGHNLWGNYVHLRNTTLSDVADYSSDDPKHKGTITDASGSDTYYDKFYLWSAGTCSYNSYSDVIQHLGNYDQAFFTAKQNAGATFDVYGIVDYYKPYAQPFEVCPIDFLWTYKPVITVSPGETVSGQVDTYAVPQTVTISATQPEWAAENVVIYYKTDDMDDWAEYTGPIVVSSNTTVQTYAEVYAKKNDAAETDYNDYVRSVTVSQDFKFQGIEDPEIAPESQVIEIVNGNETVEVIIAANNGNNPNVITVYTTDGTMPSATNGTEIAAGDMIELDPITETTTVTAVSYLPDANGNPVLWSNVVTETYTFVKKNGVIYDLLTTAPTLGNVYVIVNKDAYMGLSTKQNENNRGSVGVMFTDDTKTKVYGNDELALFVLEKADGNRYYFKNINGNGYLTVAGNTGLQTGEADYYASASVEIGDQSAGYPATITFRGDNLRTMRFFANGRTFSTYTDASLNKDVFLYGVNATPLAYIESTPSLEGKQVTVSDQLIGAWAVDYVNAEKEHINLLWAKDQGYSIDKTEINTEIGQKDYVKSILKYENKDAWDQSNWVIIDFKNLGDESAEDYVGHKLEMASVTGIYTNKDNYTIELNGAAPVRVVNSNEGDAPEFSGYGTDPKADNPQEYTEPGYNTYLPANFLDENLNYPYSEKYEDEGFVAGSGALGSHEGEKLFFMNPKVEEVARIWAVWAGTVDGKDLFTVYVPNLENGINGWAFKGAINVDWCYNRLGSNGGYGRPEYLNDGKKNHAFLFHAAIQLKSQGRSLRATNYTPSDADMNSPLSDRFMVYPLDFPSNADNFTAVAELASSRVVESVRYYNIMGMESEQPFEGINIVVTRYSDGSSSTAKVLR